MKKVKKCPIFLSPGTLNSTETRVVSMWYTCVVQYLHGVVHVYSKHYIIIPKCACVSVCLCTFYLKMANGNDLILFAT